MDTSDSDHDAPHQLGSQGGDEVEPHSADISESITDLHALAAYGELETLQEQLRVQSIAQGVPLLSLINLPDELGLTLLHSAAQSGQHHVTAPHLHADADGIVS